MVTHEANSCVRGFHMYSDIWTPLMGETLACEQESGNPNDPYAVAIKRAASSFSPRSNGLPFCVVSRESKVTLSPDLLFDASFNFSKYTF